MDSDSKQAKKLYNKQFELYSENQKNYKGAQNLRKKVTELIGDDVKNKKVLFAGCGDGFECLKVAQNGAEVFGIDISEIGIKLAKQNLSNFCENFFVGDFENTSFEDEQFDVLVSMLSIMYKKDITNVLNEFNRILKNDGNIIIAVPHPIRKMIKYNNMNYFVRGKKFETWQKTKRFNYYRIIEDYINAFYDAKLIVTKVIEPKPPKENETMSELDLHYPHYIIFKLEKLHK